jgi:hypothetical protein
VTVWVRWRRKDGGLLPPATGREERSVLAGDGGPRDGLHAPLLPGSAPARWRSRGFPSRSSGTTHPTLLRHAPQLSKMRGLNPHEFVSFWLDNQVNRITIYVEMMSSVSHLPHHPAYLEQ